MDSVTGAVPNGIQAPGSVQVHVNGGAPAGGPSAAFSQPDVVMSVPTAAEPAAEPVKAGTTAAENQSGGEHATPAGVVVAQLPDSSGNPAQAVSQPKDPLLEAFESQQEAVKADPTDFNKWVSLLSASEKLADITKIRQTYDAFLTEYPLCFGYWKKYADAEQRHSSVEAAVQVFENGVAAVPYSADLWGQYAVFKQKSGFSPGAVISVFERGAHIIGRDPGAHGFWDKYILWADGAKEPFRVAAIYRRALGQPLKQLDKYMSGVTEYVEQHSVAELFPVASERAMLEAAAKQKQAAAAEAARRAAAEAQAAAAAAAAAQAAEAATAAAAAAAAAPPPPAASAEEAAPLIGPPEAPQPAAEATAAAPQTPPTSSETGLYVHPAPAEVAANLADHVGPVTPPPGSSHHTQPALGSGQLSADQNGGTQLSDQAVAGISAPTRGEAAPVDPERSAAASQVAQQEAEPMQVDSAANGAETPAVPEADIKEAWLDACRVTYEATKEEVTRRKAFEDVIRRPYFHVKPLDAAQLSAWSHYIDYMNAKGDEAETRHLFERCLVACARYPDFWMRYARYLEPQDIPAAKHAVHRGQKIHCKAISEMQLFAARFHERHGEVPEARAAYGLILGRLAPGLISAVLAHANFERRQGDKAAACAAYQKAIAAAVERGADGEKAYVHLTVQFAHFLLVVYKDLEGARSAYSLALEKLPRSQTLWEGAIHLEQVSGAPIEEMAKSVLGLYQRAIASADLLPSDKEDLSARACTFADLCGSAAMQEAAERLHAARIKSATEAAAPAAPSVGAKRPAEISEAHSPSKQARTAAAAPSAAPPAAYPVPAPTYSTAPYTAPPAAPAAVPVASAAGYYGQPAAGYQYPGYAYPGYGQPGYPAYSYPQY